MYNYVYVYNYECIIIFRLYTSNFTCGKQVQNPVLFQRCQKAVSESYNNFESI